MLQGGLELGEQELGVLVGRPLLGGEGLPQVRHEPSEQGELGRHLLHLVAQAQPQADVRLLQVPEHLTDAGAVAMRAPQQGAQAVEVLGEVVEDVLGGHTRGRGQPAGFIEVALEDGLPVLLDEIGDGMHALDSPPAASVLPFASRG